MKSFGSGRRDLAIMAAVYLAVLILAGEFYWGSDASFLFGAMWIFQATKELWQARHAPSDSSG